MLLSFRSLCALSMFDARLAHIVSDSSWLSFVRSVVPLPSAKGLRIRMRRKVTHYRDGGRLVRFLDCSIL